MFSGAPTIMQKSASVYGTLVGVGVCPYLEMPTGDCFLCVPCPRPQFPSWAGAPTGMGNWMLQYAVSLNLLR